MVLTLCVIFPPPEFKSAGLTLEAIFQNWLGNEHELFVQYHVRRTTMNLFLHSMVPFGEAYCVSLSVTSKSFDVHNLKFTWFTGYILGLEYVRAYSYTDVEHQFLATWSLSWTIYVIFSTLIPLSVCTYFYLWFNDLLKDHPIARKLAVYRNPGASWLTVASDINIEYRRVNKIIIQSSSVVRVVATDNWVIKISPYTLDIAHQSDTALILSSADVHQWSPHINDNVQFVNIEVKPTRQNATPFKIRFDILVTDGVFSVGKVVTDFFTFFFVRLNALDLKDLQNRISRPITILENVRVRRSLIDRFLETFSDEVSRNPVYTTTEVCILFMFSMLFEYMFYLLIISFSVSGTGIMYRLHASNCQCQTAKVV